SDPGPVFHTIVSIKNDGHYFCRAGGNRPDGLNEPVTDNHHKTAQKERLHLVCKDQELQTALALRLRIR
ncbi:hypothetical protein R1D48_24220, partial [Escherichia coli]